MNEYEAITRLKDHFRVHDDGRPTPLLNEACVVAYRALEKQIPKEPIIVHPLQENDSGEFACPICKTGALVKRIDKFCWNCGQAIKWE